MAYSIYAFKIVNLIFSFSPIASPVYYRSGLALHSYDLVKLKWIAFINFKNLLLYVIKN